MSYKTDRNRVTDKMAYDKSMDRIFPEGNIIYIRKRWKRWYVWFDDDQNPNPMPRKGLDWSFESRHEAMRKAFELKEEHNPEFGPCQL